MKRSTKRLLKWLFYSLLLFLLIVIQTTPNLLEIKGTKPILVIPLAVFIAVFEGEISSFVFAVITGIVWDMQSNKILGFSSIIISICCVAVAMLVIYLIRANIVNCCILSAGVTGIYCLLDFICYYFIWGYDGMWYLVVSHFIPMIIYTTVVSPLIFIIVKSIASKYNDILRV